MTPEEIRDKLFIPIDKDRVNKAKGLAQRSRIDWSRVTDLLSDAQRQQIEDALKGD